MLQYYSLICSAGVDVIAEPLKNLYFVTKDSKTVNLIIMVFEWKALNKIADVMI